jgi:hypothetical protein
MIGLGFLPNAFPVPEWRNWQTRETQNLVHFTVSVGSIPSSGTNFRTNRAMRNDAADDEQGRGPYWEGLGRPPKGWL